MNTYFLYREPERTAAVLDRQRLGKQRLEAAQIAKLNLGLAPGRGWRNHPIVRAWRPYLGYLVTVYFETMLNEWERRGYRNEKMRAAHSALKSMVTPSTTPPPWITEEFIRSHRAYLIRRFPEYYRPLFPDIPEYLPLIWPGCSPHGSTGSP